MHYRVYSDRTSELQQEAFIQDRKSNDAELNRLELIDRLCDGLDPIKIITLIKEHPSFGLILENLRLQLRIDELETIIKTT